MNILVCFKVAPEWDGAAEGDWEALCSNEPLEYVKLAVNCFDESALEIALRLKEAVGGHATAVTLGEPPQSYLCKGLYAAGFDRVAVIGGEPAEFRPQPVAAALAAFCRQNAFDVILTGKQAGYADTGAVPLFLAEELGLPVIYDAEDVSAALPNMLVTRETDTARERLTVRPPFVAAIGNSPVSALRAVTLKARLAAGGMEAEVYASAIEPAKPPTLTRPTHDSACEFWGEGAARRVLAELAAAARSAAPQPTDGLARPIAPLRLAAARLSRRLNCDFFPDVYKTEQTEHGLRLYRKACGSNLDWAFCPGQTPFVAITTDGKALVGDGQTVRGQTLETDDEAWVISRERLETRQANPLTVARRVIIGGRGLGSRDACDKLREAARRLGCACGFTRPAAMNGWCGLREIVGQSGVQTAPDVCVAVGVSGSAAFMAGLSAKRLIAVNTDKDAPIFKRAHVGIAADAREFIQALSEGDAVDL